MLKSSPPRYLDYSTNILELKPKYVLHGMIEDRVKKNKAKVLDTLSTYGGELIEILIIEYLQQAFKMS